MKKQTSKHFALLRISAVLPIICLCLYGFSDRPMEIPKADSIEIILQDSVGPEMVKEYNQLARKYNSEPQDPTLIKNSDLKRISYIYNKMNSEQRAMAEPFPKFAEPPLPPAAMDQSHSPEGNDPPPPPPPPPAPPSLSPVEFIQEMASKNASFYFNNRGISATEALKRVKQIKDLHIITKASHTDPPTVYLSKAGNKK